MAECNCQICLARSGKGQEMMQADIQAKNEARLSEAMAKVKQEEALKQQQYEQKLQIAKQQLHNMPSNALDYCDLGWMQSPLSTSKTQFFEEYFFTNNTPIEDKNRILSLNSHINDPIKKGEIIVVSHGKPYDEKTRKDLHNLTEQSKATSKALAELSDAENDVLHKYFPLFDDLTSEYLLEAKLRGWPTDVFAEASAGVGALATGTKSHLESINKILKEIENLYIDHVAKPTSMGKKINYSTFKSQRAMLFSKLDNSFSKLTFNQLKIPTYNKLKNTLKLSTKSVIHNADEIVRGRSVPDFGKRIANVSGALKGTESVGKVGIVLSAASASNSIYDACVINEHGECGKTSTVEVAGFIGGWVGGATMLFIGVSSVPVLGIGIAVSEVIGGFSGGVIGGGFFKILADPIYEYTDDFIDKVFH